MGLIGIAVSVIIVVCVLVVVWYYVSGEYKRNPYD